jgi:hypothetical protein
MKIGVAIPCYSGHIEKLYNLLDSIENQTLLPDKVVISCSSTKELKINRDYNFCLQIILNEEQKNVSQNRNIAGLNLNNMDYITFIDADDIMHPQRIEFLFKTFQSTNSDIILHNYHFGESTDIFKYYETVNFRINSMTKCYSGCITHYDKDSNFKIHHGHVSVKRHIFEKVKFPEEEDFHTREDSVFCFFVFSLPDITNAYIVNELSLYNPSSTGGYKC